MRTEESYITEDNMRRLLLVKTYFLTLLFLSYLSMALGGNSSESLEQGQSVNGVNQSVPRENSTKASSTVSGTESSEMPQPVLVIQTPAAVTVMEGSPLCMECLFQINSPVWSIQWYKNGTESSLTDSSRMTIIRRTEEKVSHLILNKTEIADSGIYRCILYNSSDYPFPSNGTRLTIDGITDLMVNQTLEHVSQPEGTNVTIECRFRTVSEVSSTEVRWFKNETELNSMGDSLRIQVDLDKGFSSLTLTNAAVTDSGNYSCRVEVRSRNLTGSGKTSRVAITKVLAPQNAEDNKRPSTSLSTIGAGAGAVVTILLLLVVAVVFMWKRRSKGILVSRSQLESSPAKEIGLHPPLANQPSEVTYADLHFCKKEVRPDAEVVYAEVRAPRKQPACRDAKQMRPAGNQRR